MKFISRTLVVVLATSFSAAFAQDEVSSSGETVVVQDKGSPSKKRRTAQNNTNSTNVIVDVKDANANTNTTVVKQPTTYVEASPLDESAADRLRRRRQDYEVQTEQKIVEKLEESRLEDERQRADKLFGNRLGKEEQAKPAPIYTEHQMPQQQVVVPAEQKVTPEDLANTKQEILSAIKENQSVVVEAPKEEKPKDRYYIMGLVGTADYPDAVNIEGRGAGGVAIGMEMPNHFMVEGNFLYSKFVMEERYWFTYSPIFKDLDQYNLGLNVKYSPLQGRFQPLIGFGGHYTYRKYSDRLVQSYPGYALPGDREVTSTAFDLMFLIGAEVSVSDGFAVGVDYRYNTNVFYNSDSSFLSSRYLAEGITPVEEANYSIISIYAKARF